MALGNYFDIDAILVEDERVPCVFNTSAFNLGHLDPGKGDKDLQEGSRIPLPLWMGGHLARKNYVLLNLPQHYGATMRSRLSADAASVPVRDRSAHYFEVGMRLCSLITDLEVIPEVKEALRSGLGQRVVDLVSRAQSAHGKDLTLQCRQLTDEERDLFNLTRATCLEFDNWRSRKRPYLAASQVVSSVAKRRRR